jgi:hypothetical protein
MPIEQLLAAPLSGHQIMINGHALCPPSLRSWLRSLSARNRGGAPRSEVRTNDPDRQRSVDCLETARPVTARDEPGRSAVLENRLDLRGAHRADQRRQAAPMGSSARRWSRSISLTLRQPFGSASGRKAPS